MIKIFILIIMQYDGHVPNYEPPKYDTIEHCQDAAKLLIKGKWFKNYNSGWPDTAEGNLQATCIPAMEFNK